MKALYHWAKRACSTKEQFNRQVNQIEQFMSRNGYPSFVRNLFVKYLKHNENDKNSNESDNRMIIWIKNKHISNAVMNNFSIAEISNN